MMPWHLKFHKFDSRSVVGFTQLVIFILSEDMQQVMINILRFQPGSQKINVKLIVRVLREAYDAYPYAYFRTRTIRVRKYRPAKIIR